jgi:uncharacterized RDD family membrane protein YckC
MKCPKCGYLGFEHVERCRNCGYDFLLSTAVELPELAMRDAHAGPNPLADLELVDRTARVDTDSVADEMGRGIDRALRPAEPADIGLPGHAPAPMRAAPPPQPARSDAPPHDQASVAAARVPLFPPAADDVPLITRPSPPRQPLAVRRSSPDIPRARTDMPRGATLNLPLDSNQVETAATRVRPAAAGGRSAEWGASGEPDRETAGLVERLTAGAIDLLILATIDAAVIYFTLQICAVSFTELAIVPKAPLVAFLLVQNGGYLVAFTVGGQTLGKMAAGIKVVPAESEASLDVGRAVLRTLLWVVLAVPAGLGFLSAFFNRDCRGLHDRFAGTRVVRASV